MPAVPIGLVMLNEDLRFNFLFVQPKSPNSKLRSVDDRLGSEFNSPNF